MSSDTSVPDPTPDEHVPSASTPNDSATNPPPSADGNETGPWYQGVTGYQWMVLAIASAGWVFDVFEGQVFGACMHEALPILLAGTGLESYQELFLNIGLGAFLAGGAIGGVVFGMLADRWGRRWTMAVTIAIYSLFTGLTAFSQTWWHLTALRFLVGLGVGGEWAVAAAIVAEIFPPRARPVALGIFHGSSILGAYLAQLTGYYIVSMDPEWGWRYGFLVGVLPALLILWVRVSMKEPESWEHAKKQAETDSTRKLGRFTELFTDPKLCRNTLLAMSLALIGLVTFWSAHFRGKDVLREQVMHQISHEHPEMSVTELGNEAKPQETLGWFLVTTGGGIGLFLFAPLSQRIGRRGAFAVFHVGGLLLVAVVYLLRESWLGLVISLPIFGFFTLGMHAGYAVYFPELFPTRLRGTGAGFCFNAARLFTVPVILVFGLLQGPPLELGLATAMLVMSCFFLVGLVLLVFAPETRGKPLPE